nr:UDP-glucose 4-epimerase GalE [Saprospiraceae bacterium]
GPFEAIIHFAAYKSVGESMSFPFKYYQNNIPSVLNISEAAIQNHIRHFIFSSSCSVYGNAEKIPVTEQTPMGEPTSPYGLTKQIGEQHLVDLTRRYPEFKLTLLRYFNPAGAHPSAKIGEASRKPSTNLVPIICEVAAGKREKIVVYGDDYPTRDGSCIRDYIHVMDLAEAHTAALEYSIDNGRKQKVEAFNLGIGEGVSVLEAIAAFEKTTGEKIHYTIGKQRPGDVSAIYARYDKAQRELKWSPRRSIEDIMASAWAWEKNRWGK